MKKIYFLSDAHLGSRALTDNVERERRLCLFMDMARQDASAIYLLGDMFDFWFEYHNLIPKGFVRFLGKIAELADNGIEIHCFTGNHDMWAFDYLQKECGVILHTQPCEIVLPSDTGADISAFLAHGDGLGDDGRGIRFLQSVFHSRLCQWLFRNVMPADLGMEFGLRWAKASRIKHSRITTCDDGNELTVSSDGSISNDLGDVLARNVDGEEPFKGEDREPLVLYAKRYITEHPHIDYFLFGHRHIELDLMLSRQTRMLILGEWISKFTYAVWDGSSMTLDNFDVLY